MSQSLFCAFPTLREAFGHVNLEAMTAWKHVVATDWGAKDLIVDGVTEFKVLGRSPEQYIETLASVGWPTAMIRDTGNSP